MKKLGSLVWSIALLLAAASATSVAAQSTRDLTTIFPYEADVALDAPGLHLVPLTPEILGRTQPSLRDLRVFDAAGNEVPWTLESAVPPSPRVDARDLVPRDVRESTERPAFSGERRREVLTLDIPDRPADRVVWDLALASARGRFVRSVLVERLDAAGAPVETLFEGSIYRLPSPRRERLRIPLGKTSATVRLTLEGEDEAFLSPRVTLVAIREAAPPETLAVELLPRSITSAHGRTLVRLERPRGLVPNAIRIETATRTFLRSVSVTDLGFGSEARPIGSGAVYRVADLADAFELDVAIDRARGDTLEVAIEDGDTPALEALRFVAIVARPALLVDAQGPLVVRYGGGRALAPRYDLSRIAHLPETRELLDRGIAEARLGASRPNPHHDPAPALGFAMRAGSDAEVHRFHRVRSLVIPGGGEGASRIRLAAEDLSVLRPDLGDVRVVDDRGRQWPFLLERDAATERVRVRVSERTEDGRTHYDLAVPSHPVPVSALDLVVAAPFVDRDYTLLSTRGERKREIARGRLVRRPETDDVLRIAVDEITVDALELVVDDGGDAALSLSGVDVEVRVPELYVAAPAGNYRLLLGSEAVAPPRYELGRARSMVLSVDAAEATLGPLNDNPDFVPDRRHLPLDEMLLWAVLLAAVLVLGVLTLRVIRKEADPPNGSEGRGPGPGPDAPVPAPPSSVSSGT